MLGQKVPGTLDLHSKANVANEVVKQYLEDYAKAWDGLLQDIEIAPLRSLNQASQDLYILASKQSPLKELLVAIARQLTLSEPPKSSSAEAVAAEVEKAAKDKAASVAPTVAKSAALAALLTGQSGAAPTLQPGHEIDERYRQLRELVSPPGSAPIDQVLKLLDDLRQQLARLNAAGVGAVAVSATTDDPSLALRAESQRQPQPLGRWLAGMAEQSTALRSGGARQQVAAAYNGVNGPGRLCAPAVNGRFPFVSGSSNETPLDDFAKLFAPGGLVDGFFNTHLRPYVNTTGKTWTPQAVDGVSAPLSPADIAQFQRAAVIRDLFFASGSTTISVRFDITPVELDAGASQVSLELDGTSVTYAHGPARSTQINWPGPNGMTNVRLVFNPPPARRNRGPVRDGAMGDVSPVRSRHVAAGRVAGALSVDLLARRPQRSLRDPRGFGHESLCARRPARFPLPGGQRLAVMTALPPDASAGLFGKLPARGDFVRENLPRDFTDAWDAWWQRGLAEHAGPLARGLA